MKQLMITAGAILSCLVTQAQISETRNADVTDRIEVHDGIEVIFTQASVPSLKVETSNQETLNKLVTINKKGILKVYLKDNQNSNSKKFGLAKVYIEAPNLTEIFADTGAFVVIKDKLETTHIDIKLASGANCSATIDAIQKCKIEVTSGSGYNGIIHTETFVCNATNGGHLRITGNSEKAEVHCKGGSMQAGKFVCEKAWVYAQNASAVSIWANDFLSTDTDASSAITYYGEPKKVKTSENTYTIERETQKLTLN